MHWIGCALYVACRESSTPTVGRPGSNVEGNCVSLTRLLRLCNLSLIQFFAKCKSWADMANIPHGFRTKIDKLERNFAVSMVIFKKYQPIFNDIFKNIIDDNTKPSRSRRNRVAPCTTTKAFEFCWTLFICVKGAFPDISDDLVNSYHLLLACCDFVYSNALLSNRKDLLNPNFIGKFFIYILFFFLSHSLLFHYYYCVFQLFFCHIKKQMIFFFCFKIQACHKISMTIILYHQKLQIAL